MAMASDCKPAPNGEHPVVAWIGILAIVLAILLIIWARVAVHGTGDLEAALSDDGAGEAVSRKEPSPEADRREEELHDAVATGRWATGFSP
jgi:hypothetical protein